MKNANCAALLFAAVVLGCNADSVIDSTDDAPATGTYQLGSVRVNANSQLRACPSGFSCIEIQSTCAQLRRPLTGYAAVANPGGTPRGVIVFFRGGGGTEWVFDGQQDRAVLLDQLRADGFRIVQIRWSRNWIEADPGEDAGPARLACHPATAVRWVYDTYFVPLNIPRSTNGSCGFCVTGNSGGSTQTAFALTHYGLDTIIDAAIPTGGPPHGALAKACLRVPEEQRYWMPAETRSFFDRGYGIYGGNGPCLRNDPSFTARWNQESVTTGGSDYTHPRTRVHLLVGAQDAGMQPYAADYAAKLRSSGSPWVTYDIVPNTPHNIMGSAEGRSALRAALLASR